MYINTFACVYLKAAPLPPAPWLTSYVETLIIDAKMFENYGLEGVSGALGSGLACLVGDFGARTSPKEPKT